MAQVACDTGLSRESLYKALAGDRSSGFDTILKVTKPFGLTLHARASTRRTIRPASRSGGRMAKRRQRRDGLGSTINRRGLTLIFPF